MKKVLALLLMFSCGALYGVCACQRPKPQPQPQTTEQTQNQKGHKTPAQTGKARVTPVPSRK